MAETFVGLMPDFDEYREPFLGGGSVYIATRQLRPDKKYWVNDLYYDLYCFWLEVQRDNPDLVKEIRETRRRGFSRRKIYVREAGCRYNGLRC